MAALSADRDTARRNGDQFSYPVEAATTIFKGSMVALNAAGNLVPFGVATTLKFCGRADQHIANPGAAGDQVCEVRQGEFLWDNSTSGDAITKAAIGTNCYGVDDHTVALTSASSTRSVAGVIVDVIAEGVWVKQKF